MIAAARKGFQKIEAQDVSVGMRIFHIENGVPGTSFTVERVRPGFTDEVRLSHSFMAYGMGEMIQATNSYHLTHNFCIQIASN